MSDKGRLGVLALLGTDVGLLDLRSFWRTRRAVPSTADVVDLTSRQRRARGIMDPWLFNLQETLLATLPAVVIGWVLGLLYGQPRLAADPAAGARAEYYAEIYPDLESTSVALAIPLTLMLTAPIFAWGSLRSTDRNARSMRRAMHAYLYLDGGYGFFAMVLIVLPSAFSPWLSFEEGELFRMGSEGTRPPDEMALLFLLVMLISFVGLCRELYLLLRLIPSRLFDINGYGTGVALFTSKSAPDGGPIGRFYLAVLAMVIVWGMVQISAIGVAIGVSHILALGKASLLGALAV